MMNTMREPALKAMTCIKSIDNRISLLNNFFPKFFEHRFHALFAYIVSDDTHFGIGNSPFWAVKMAWQMKRTTSKLWPFFIFLIIEWEWDFLSFFLPKTGMQIKHSSLLFSPPDTIKMYGKMNAFTYETLLGHEQKAAVTLIRFK